MPAMLRSVLALGYRRIWPFGSLPVAVDSDATVHEAAEVNALRSHYPKVRRSLQRKGTKGRSLRSLRPHSGAEAKRLLKRLSGRERRHMRAINHRISKQLVETAQTTGRHIALEDLTGIRQRIRVRRPQRYCHHSWSFYQLRQFVAYKAQVAGVPLGLVGSGLCVQDMPPVRSLWASLWSEVSLYNVRCIRCRCQRGKEYRCPWGSRNGA
jgi:IS605 OrfB family transposase